MATKLVFVVGLLFVSLVAVLGAPRAATEEELKKSVIQFLKQDKQFVAELEKMKMFGDGSALSRQRRQAEIDASVPDSVEVDEKPGFFDRAAKFIVDLLQRFLKWINNDSD